MSVAGTFFPAGSSRAVPARAAVSKARVLSITDEAGAVLVEAPLRTMRVSPRLGQLVRRLELADNSRFETADNDGVDAMLRAAGRLRRGTLIDRLERSLKWVLASAAFAGLSAALMVLYGFPAAADWLARATPRPMLRIVSTQTLDAMDRLALKPSRLPQAERAHAQALFARVAAVGHDGRSGYRLIFRDGGAIGPNAFSLPDGTVIMTDALYPLIRRDDELEGVFGHEIAHADRRHAMRLVYVGSLLPATIALMTGDASQFGQIATVLPTLLIESSYSRAVEQQADDDSAAMMLRIGADPAALGTLLERMDHALCGRQGCSPGWLGSHPATAERAAKLREEALAVHLHR